MELNIEQNKKEIICLLKKVERSNIDKLISWLSETDFFSAPASSKFHLNVEGGLAYHSLSVYKTLCKFNELIPKKWKLSKDSVILCGLLHDVCKIGIYHYVLKEEQVRSNYPDDLFEYKRDDPFPIGHGDKSIILLQRYIYLTEEEIALIRWHMGPYDPEFNRGQKQIVKKYPWIKLLYLADDFSTQFLENIE